MSVPYESAFAQGAVRPEPADEATKGVFDQSQVRSYELTISRGDKQRIDGNPSAEEWVRGTLRYDGKTYDPVGIRYKGSVGAFLPPCTEAGALPGFPARKDGKCSIKISFDKYNKEGRFFGLKTINLHALNRDRSLMRDRLGYSLFRDMGVAAPRSMHAKVTVNGELEGVFLAVEQIDDEFVEGRWAEGGKGNLYKEIWPTYTDPAMYRNALETNKGSRTDVSKMLAFERAIRSGSSAVTRILDRDYMLRYLAVDRLIINDDGFLHWYCGTEMGNNKGGPGNHNYYWYEAQTSDDLWLIPWDLDSSFGDGSTFVHLSRSWFDRPLLCGCEIGPGGVPQRPAGCDPLTQIMGSWRSDYERTVADFVRGAFSAARVDAKIEAMQTQLRTLVEEESRLRGHLGASEWRNEISTLRRIISDSRRNGGGRY